MAVPFSELQKIAPSAIIELSQLELTVKLHGVSETHYFHAGTNSASGDIVWAGQAYQAWPIEATEFEYNGTGSLPRPKLVVANTLGTITALIETLPDGLEGAKVTRRRTLARYIDGVNFPGGVNPYGTPSTDEFPPEIYYIDRKVTENRDLIEFELAAGFDLAGVRPGRQCVSNVCQWEYRGLQCGYTGNAYFNFNDEPVTTLSQDQCGKRLRSCELRFAQLRFPGVVTAGSNVITMDQATALSTGDPVAGFGLPSGATVVSVSGRAVTVSQNATVSTNVGPVTGTITTAGNQIVLASAAGIVPGMTVTGSYLRANTQVVAVSGNTVTLSAPVALEQFYTSITSATAATGVGRTEVLFPDGSTAAVGQFIASETLPLSRRAVITGTVLKYVTASGFGKQLTRYKILQISQAAETDKEVLWTTYTGGTIPSATYTFVATDRNYTFRANAAIRYGSFPGIGSFFS